MTAIQLMILEMEQNLENVKFIEGSLVKESILAHILLAKNYLSVEDAKLNAEYQKGYQQGYTDAQGVY